MKGVFFIEESFQLREKGVLTLTMTFSSDMELHRSSLALQFTKGYIYTDYFFDVLKYINRYVKDEMLNTSFPAEYITIQENNHWPPQALDKRKL